MPATKTPLLPRRQQLFPLSVAALALLVLDLVPALARLKVLTPLFPVSGIRHPPPRLLALQVKTGYELREMRVERTMFALLLIWVSLLIVTVQSRVLRLVLLHLPGQGTFT